MQKKRAATWFPEENLRVDEGNHDVSGALGDAQTLVVMGEAARVHQHPTLARILHGAVVADKPTATTLNSITKISCKLYFFPDSVPRNQQAACSKRCWWCTWTSRGAASKRVVRQVCSEPQSSWWREEAVISLMHYFHCLLLLRRLEWGAVFIYVHIAWRCEYLSAGF